MPLISIITVNYNNKAGLEKTIRSVCGQTYREFEYIVVDGASSDGSAELLNIFSACISHGISEKDTGIYNAQNKGIQLSKGEYLLFLNSGDFLVNDQVLDTVVKSGLDKDIVYGNMRINWGHGHITQGYMPDSISIEHMVHDTLWHPVSFIRRSLFNTIGLYNESYRLAADYDFFFHALIAKKVSSKHISICISEYDTGGMSSKKENKELEKSERNKVISTYLSPEEISRIKPLFNNKRSWLNKVNNYLRSLINRT